MLKTAMGKAAKRKTKYYGKGIGAIADEKLMRPAGAPLESVSLLKQLLIVLPVIILGLIVYANAVNTPYQFDDAPYIVDNPLIKNLGYFLSFPQELNSIIYIKTRYITHLTFALNYALNGLNVAGYHIFNISVHIMNALLVYLLVTLTSRTPAMRPFSGRFRGYGHYMALFSALLFVCHPLQTQAVTYITQRFASLTTFFYLISIILYIRARVKQTEDSLHKSALFIYLFSLAATVLAMKTKEISFTIPIIIVLYEFMFFEGPVKRRTIFLIPFLLTLLIIPLAMVGSARPSGDMVGKVSEAARSLSPLSRSDYLFTQFRVITTYIRLFLFPMNQNLDYDYPLYHSLLQLPVFLSFLLLLSLLGTGVFIFRRFRNVSPYARLVSFGIFWFFIALSVESSIIPIGDVIFEHRVYLPSVGVCIAITASLLAVKTRLDEIRPQLAKSLLPAFVLIVLAFASAAIARNRVWQDDIGFWKDVISKSPHKERGHNNLGTAYSAKGLMDQAIDQYQTALKIEPDHAEAHNNLGTVYFKKDLLNEAIEHLKAALKTNPDYADAHNNLGSIYLKQGLTDEAIVHLDTALKLKPSLAAVHSNLGAAYSRKGMFDEAIAQYHIALDTEPDNAAVHFNLANSYFKKDLTDEAIAEFRAALQTDPENALTHYSIGMVFMKKGLKSEAIKEFKAALEIKPDFAEARRARDSAGE